MWQHAVIETTENSKPASQVNFNPNTGALSTNDYIDSPAAEFLKNSMEREKRQYRRTKKPRVPRYWRSRKDPFEEVWDEICTWLEEHPERTSKSLFIELQERYPDQYKDGQLRTLQRRVKEWRSEAILTFDYEWINDELFVKDNFITEFQGKLIREADL